MTCAVLWYKKFVGLCRRVILLIGKNVLALSLRSDYKIINIYACRQKKSIAKITQLVGNATVFQ